MGERVPQLKTNYGPDATAGSRGSHLLHSDNEHVILTSETARQSIWKVHVSSQQQSKPDTTKAIERSATPLKTTEAQ